MGDKSLLVAATFRFFCKTCCHSPYNLLSKTDVISWCPKRDIPVTIIAGTITVGVSYTEYCLKFYLTFFRQRSLNCLGVMCSRRWHSTWLSFGVEALQTSRSWGSLQLALEDSAVLLAGISPGVTITYRDEVACKTAPLRGSNLQLAPYTGAGGRDGAAWSGE